MSDRSPDAGGTAAPRLADQLIGRCRALLVEHLDALVGPTIERTRDAMLDEAERARSTELQGRLVAAFNLLRRHQDDFSQHLHHMVEESFRDCFGDAARRTEHHAPEDSGLELVADDVLDEALAVDQLVHRLELRFTRELHALGRRLTVLNGGRPVSAEANPLGPAQLGRSLQRAAGVLPVEAGAKLRLLRTFEQLVLDGIGSLYDDVNMLLKEAGILPNIRFEVERQQRSAAANRQREQAGEQPAVRQRPPGAAPSRRGAVERADTLTREVQSESRALMGQIEALLDRMHAGRPVPPPEKRVAPGDMGEVLRDMQRQYSPQRGETLDAEAIKRRLGRALSQRGKAIAPEQEKTIDLMGMVYEYLREDLKVIEQVKHLFEQLQLPLLRVAMSDGDFFQREDHPARQFFNTLSEAGDLWLGDHPEGSDLLDRLQTAVADVAEADGEEIGRFSERLEEIRRHIALSARKAQLAERRQVQARKGQEKLRVARLQAHDITEKLVEKFAPPPFARSLIEEAWADYLALLHLRHGDDSAEWQGAVATIRFIAVAVSGRVPASGAVQLRERMPKLLDELHAGLSQVGFTETEAAEAVDRIREAVIWAMEEREEAERPAELDKPMPQPAARKNEPREKPPVTAKSLEAALSPGERQELARLRLAQFGSWFELAGPAPGSWVKRKLAWFSPVTGRCLLTDVQGHGTELTLAELARKLHAGTARRFEPPSQPLLDRALSAVVARLKRMTGQAPGDAAAH